MLAGSKVHLLSSFVQTNARSLLTTVISCCRNSNAPSKNYDLEYLQKMDRDKLVYRVIRMQRLIDYYEEICSPLRVCGKDKVRIAHPDPEEIISKQTSMRKIALKILYLGWDYAAYAWEDRMRGSKFSGSTNSVERVLLEAILRQQLIPYFGSSRTMNLERCGRTDQHVSGLAQVVTARVRSNLNEGFGIWSVDDEIEEIYDEKSDKTFTRNLVTYHEEGYSNSDTSLDEGEIPYIKLLNAALPVDIRVLAWAPVGKKFSARHQCHVLSKNQNWWETTLPPTVFVDYSISTERNSKANRIAMKNLVHQAKAPTLVQWLNQLILYLFSPIFLSAPDTDTCRYRTYRYVFPRANLDVELMNSAAQKLVGEHDFRNFCKRSDENLFKHMVREIISCKIEALPGSLGTEVDLCSAVICGKSFLHKQIRNIIGILIFIGSGQTSPTMVEQLLDIETNPRKPRYDIAVSRNLTLIDCGYESSDISWRWDDAALANAASILAAKYTNYSAKSETLRHMYADVASRITDKDLAKSSQFGFLQSILNTDPTGPPVFEYEGARSISEKQSVSRKRKVKTLINKGRYLDAVQLRQEQLNEVSDEESQVAS